MKFEYKLLSSPGWDVDALNRLGDDGWKLVGFTRDNGAVLKRVKLPTMEEIEAMRKAMEDAPLMILPTSSTPAVTTGQASPVQSMPNTDATSGQFRAGKKRR